MKSNSIYKDAFRINSVIFLLGLIEFILFSIFLSFRADILIGALYGCTFTSLNIFYLAYCVKKAVEKEEKAAKAYMSSTYTVRMIFIAIMVVIAAKTDFIHLWAAVIPLFFQRVAVTIVALFNKRSEKA